MRAALALLFVFLLALAVWLWIGTVDSHLPGSAVSESSLPPNAATVAEPAKDEAVVRTAVLAAQAPAAIRGSERLLVYPAQRETTTFEGIVLDAEEHQVAGLYVHLDASAGAFHPRLAIGEDRATISPVSTDSQGRFHFERVPVGPYVVRATAQDGNTARQLIAVTTGDTPPVILHLAAPEIPSHLTVVVVDADNTPVGAGTVAVHLITPAANLLNDEHIAEFSATFDSGGRCEFKNVPLQPLVIDANTPDGRRGTLLLDEQRRRYSAGHAVVTVTASGGIAGTLRGATAELLRGSSVRALQILVPDMAYYSTLGRVHTANVVADGFEFTNLPAGVFALQLDSPQGLRFELPAISDVPNSVVPLTLEVHAGEVARISALVAMGDVLAGNVLTLEGQPIAGARVEAVLTPVSANLCDGFAMFGAFVWRLDSPESLCMEHPEAHPSVNTDSAGAYRMQGLTPGAYRVDVFAPGHSFDQRLGVHVELGKVTSLEHRLSAGGVIQGNASGVTYLGAVPKDKEQPVMLAVLPDDGLFTLPGLAAGDYVLASFPSDTRFGYEPLVNVHVDEGRTTWVDLSHAGSLHFDGRLIESSGRGVRGQCNLFGQRIRTASDGSFTFQRFPTVGRPLWWPEVLVEADGLQWRVEFSPEIREPGSHSGTLTLGDQILEVELQGPDGRPAAGTLLISGEFIVQSRIAVGADGRARLRHLLPGDYWLNAEVPGAVVAPKLARVPASAVLELKSVASSPIEVSVVDAEGKPAARIRVFAFAWQSDDPAPSDLDVFEQKAQFFESTTDDDGHARIFAPSGLVLLHASGWYIGDPTARQMITTVRGQLSSVVMTVR